MSFDWLPFTPLWSPSLVLQQPIEKTTEEITKETKEVLTRVARLEAAAAGKKHNEL
jgi:hypothetical protein